MRDTASLPDYYRVALDSMDEDMKRALFNRDAEAGLSWFLVELARVDAPVSLVAKAVQIVAFMRSNDIQRRRLERLIGAFFLRKIDSATVEDENGGEAA